MYLLPGTCYSPCQCLGDLALVPCAIDNQVCPAITRSNKEVDVAWDVVVSDRHLEECSTAHLEKRTIDNYRMTLTKWDSFMKAKYLDKNLPILDVKTAPPKEVCRDVIEFVGACHKSKPFKSLKCFKNMMTHINQAILKPAGKEYSMSDSMSVLQSWLKGFKKKLSKEIDAMPEVKKRSVAYGVDNWLRMYMSVCVSENERTTEQTAQLIMMTIVAWTGPRCASMHKLKMKHVQFVKDSETEGLKNGKQGCGFMVCKNWQIDKTNMVPSESKIVQSGEVHSATTLYCQCHDPEFEICGVKMLLSYREALKEGTKIMKHKHGSEFGDWLGDPASRTCKDPVMFDELPFFRKIKA